MAVVRVGADRDSTAQITTYMGALNVSFRIRVGGLGSNGAFRLVN